MSGGGTSERGSVLVDALVAIGIMGLTLAFAADAVGDGARRTHAAELSRLAVLEARSRLAEVGGDIPLQAGRDTGEDAGLEWQVDVAPASGFAGKVGRLMEVTVQVSAPGRPALATLHSQRLAGA